MAKYNFECSSEFLRPINFTAIYFKMIIWAVANTFEAYVPHCR